MIIVGYQGIGKSTLAKGGNGFIDLESGNFWVDGKRDKNWAQIYVNIAIHLSHQGYNVFTSSHGTVRALLRDAISSRDIVKNAPLVVALCYPVLDLKDMWIDKLRRRYEASKLEKDYKALMNAIQLYEENIGGLMAEESFVKIPLKDMHYDLKEEIEKLWKPSVDYAAGYSDKSYISE